MGTPLARRVRRLSAGMATLVCAILLLAPGTRAWAQVSNAQVSNAQVSNARASAAQVSAGQASNSRDVLGSVATAAAESRAGGPIDLRGGQALVVPRATHARAVQHVPLAVDLLGTSAEDDTALLTPAGPTAPVEAGRAIDLVGAIQERAPPAEGSS
jgi:hypothetical protein